MVKEPKIIWDMGSAYDLFVSLKILHQPEQYGLRPSWAAGVRSRLPIPLRDVLDHAQQFMRVPMCFIHALPETKNAAAVLAALKALPPGDRLPALVFSGRSVSGQEDYQQFLISLEGKQRLTANVERRIKKNYQPASRATKQTMRALFDAWANRKEFGEKLYLALEAFVENFFQEEELRIIPAQKKALEQAKSLAEKNDVLTVLEQLSSGVRMDWISGVSTVILAPSFWAAPFVIFNRINDDAGIVLFGARPEGMALVPGDLVPEDLLNALKALADPTRLRILRYLLEGSTTPSELAKVLRLRPPTVIHHLHILRLAGLVLVTVSPQSERRYAIRMDGVKSSVQNLNEYLSGD